MGETAMSKPTVETSGDMVVAARRRMERWLLSPELREHMELARDVRKPAKTGPYICISREAGTGGARISRLVGRQLSWDVLDKELLDFMTKRYNMPRDMLDIVDETKANWFYDVLGAFANSRIVSHDSYVVHLERIIYLAALHGNVVFLGRGAQYVLPRDSGIAVRIIASKEMRVEAVMQRHNVSRKEATLAIDETEAGRNEFSRRHFHRDIVDPLEYELVINSARLPAQAAAELIVDTFCRAKRDAKQ